MTKSALFALALIASAATVTPTVAQAEPATVTSIVATADLDLATASGRAALDHRLVQAAREVCGAASDADLAGKNELRSCRERTLAAARADGERRIARHAGGEIRVAAR